MSNTSRRQETRRHVLHWAAASGSALAAAACGLPPATPPAKVDGPATLELFGADTPDGAPQTQQLLDVFRAKHPNVNVNYSYMQNGTPYRDKLKVLVTAGTPPDVFYLEWFVYPPYVVAGHLAEIDSLAKKDRVGVDDLWLSFVKQFTWKNKLWTLAQGMQTMVTWYNVDAFEQAGLALPKPDWTWSDFLDIARKLTVGQGDQVQRWGTTFWTALHQPPGAFISMNGGRMFDRDEEPKASTFTEPATVEALQWLADLRLKHRLAPTSDQETARGGNAAAASNIFATGGVAMNMRNVPLDLWNRTVKQFRWSAAPLPKGKAGQFSMSLSHSKAMAKAGQHQDAAWQLLSFVGGKEGQTHLTRNFDNLPCYRSVAEQDWLTNSPLIGIKKPILQSLEQGKWFPNTPAVSDALDTVNPMLNKMFNGEVSVRDGTTQIKAQVDALLLGK